MTGTSRSYETIEYALADGVALITLDREPARNAINSVMNRELPLVWRQFASDPAARVAILTGRGSKAFCTGADLKDLPVMDGGGREGSLQSIRWTPLQNEVWKPVIVAVNGMTVGGGLHFVADADIVLAADAATFFDTHVAVGLVAGLEPVALCRRLPIGAVLKMALIGGAERMTAMHAQRLGLVDEVLPTSELLARARVLAHAIARHSPAALARTKKAIWEAQELGLRAGLENAWRHILAQTSHPDVAEGAAAFLEGRPPRWAPPEGEAS